MLALALAFSALSASAGETNDDGTSIEIGVTKPGLSASVGTAAVISSHGQGGHSEIVVAYNRRRQVGVQASLGAFLEPETPRLTFHLGPTFALKHAVFSIGLFAYTVPQRQIGLGGYAGITLAALSLGPVQFQPTLEFFGTSTSLAGALVGGRWTIDLNRE